MTRRAAPASAVGKESQNTARGTTSGGPLRTKAPGGAGARLRPLASAPDVVQRLLDGVFGILQRVSAIPRWQAAGENAARIHQAAARGTSGAGGPLPYLQQIQSAFGRHDVSQVQAYTGSQATEAARAMGASAYASGKKVAFAGTPSLHTVAHEAAHTVQQQAGVQLQSGIGQVDDPYERHADVVANAVVAGRSAESLLDASPKGGAASGTENVQRKLTIGQKEEAKTEEQVWQKDAASFNDVKEWLALYNIQLPDDYSGIVNDILKEENITLNYTDNAEAFYNKIMQAKEYLDNIPDDVPDEQEQFKKRKLPGTQRPLFKPKAINLLHPDSEQWLRVKFQYAIPWAPKSHGKPAKAAKIAEDDKHPENDALDKNHLICATSATAVAAGFVIDPNNLQHIVTKSKEMAKLLNQFGKQPNAMSAAEAHAVALEFSGQNDIIVSNIYEVDGEKETSNLNEMTDYATHHLKIVIDNMDVGERIYIGRQHLTGKRNNIGKEVPPYQLDHGHAFAGIKTGNGMLWIESNAAKQGVKRDVHEMKPPGPSGLPSVGDRFKYFITTPRTEN